MINMFYVLIHAKYNKASHKFIHMFKYNHATNVSVEMMLICPPFPFHPKHIYVLLYLTVHTAASVILMILTFQKGRRSS